MVRIGDDDYPTVEVNFEQSTYAVDEGNTVEVMLTLSADPERTIIIPLTTTNEDGATGQGETDADYSGVPDTVTFVSGGETEKFFTFSAAQDSVDDDDELVNHWVQHLRFQLAVAGHDGRTGPRPWSGSVMTTTRPSKSTSNSRRTQSTRATRWRSS